jgi:hypothetical protein
VDCLNLYHLDWSTPPGRAVFSDENGWTVKVLSRPCPDYNYTETKADRSQPKATRDFICLIYVILLAENLVIGEFPMSEAEKKYEHRETELLPFLPTR